MKKLIVLLLMLAIICSLTLTAYGAEEKLTLSAGSAKAGETVYLVVTLEESVVGDTLGISYSFDSSLLKAVPTSCTWERKSVLDDFDNKNSGVWAGSKAEDLKGRVCTLALNILPDASFTETKVTCELLVKNGSQELGRYTAEAKVTLACDHRYGNWSDGGSLGHSRECEICKARQTQSHAWDDGKLMADPTDASYNLKVYNCELCGAEKSVRVPADSHNSEKPSATEPKPTAPEEEHPYTKPTWTLPEKPENSGQQGNSGSQNGREDPDQPFHDYNQGTEAVSSGDDHDHSHEGENSQSGFITKESRPVAVPAVDGTETATTDTEHDHDHDHVAPAISSGERAGTALGIAAVVLILLGGAVYFVKKKH